MGSEAAGIIASIFVFCFFFTCSIICYACCYFCCYRRKRKDHTVFQKTPVVVTSATHTAPGGYPVTTQMPMGASPYQANVYNYPAQTQPQMMQMPMPMPGMPPVAGVQQPHQTPYPPPMQMPMPGGNMNPPPYDMAVSGGPASHPNYAGYEKQSPYNPSFTAH